MQSSTTAIDSPRTKRRTDVIDEKITLHNRSGFIGLDIWDPGSRVGWSLPDFPWSSTISIVQKPRNSLPSGPKLLGILENWLVKSMSCCRLFQTIVPSKLSISGRAMFWIAPAQLHGLSS